jgi:ABC-type amino acid transport system permease subunit
LATILAGGIVVTLKLSLIVWLAGLLLGGILGVVGARWRLVGAFGYTLTFILGSIPIIVTLMWLNYPAQSLLGIVAPPFWTASFALSLVNIFSVSEIVRAAITSFPREFNVIGLVSGMSQMQVLRFITFPLLIRQILPPLLFSQVTILQATLFASLISVDEIFRVTQQINAVTYQPVTLYTALAVLFLIVCAPINALALYLKKRFGRDMSET